MIKIAIYLNSILFISPIIWLLGCHDGAIYMVLMVIAVILLLIMQIIEYK